MFQETVATVYDSAGFTVRLGLLKAGTAGPMIVFLPGMYGYCGVFRPLMERLSSQFRCLGIDLRGAGRSDKDGRGRMSLPEQSVLLRQVLARECVGENVILCGHGSGCELIGFLLQNTAFAASVADVVLLSPFDGAASAPPIMRRIASGDDGLLDTSMDAEAAALRLMAEAAVPAALRAVLRKRCAAMLETPGVPESLTATAKEMLFSRNRFPARNFSCCDFPIFVLTGEYDYDAVRKALPRFRAALPDGIFRSMEGLTHWGFAESPDEVADVMRRFLTDGAAAFAEGDAESDARKRERRGFFRMAKLFDHWNMEAVLLFCFIKLLQFLKLCGLSPAENGWRKATGIFLKNENAKFTLASFSLRYYRKERVPETEAEAKKVLIGNLAEFLRGEPDTHWAIEPGLLRLKRRRLGFVDLVEVDCDRSGRIVSVVPCFDGVRGRLSELSKKDEVLLLNSFQMLCNEELASGRKHSARRLGRKLRRAVLLPHAFNPAAALELDRAAERLLSATFIHFEVLPSDPAAAERRRFASPGLRTARHPGTGLLNIECRFAADLAEADLFVQYHHVPVDGLPMQELMARLKRNWGETRPLVYPASGTPASRPEIFYSGDRLFRARFFVDFGPLLKMRKYLNRHCRREMGGEATVAAMLLWGLARHEFFRSRKMLLPVDMAGAALSGKERELGLVFIRPAEFADAASPLAGFCRFQKEFNRRCRRTRFGRSESHELMELYAMIHPLFYYFAKRFLSGALDEVVGTVGLSIMRGAELFLAPLSDLQSDGFLALGAMNVPTSDGRRAGAVSVCGRREQIACYIEAVNRLAAHYADFLELNMEDLV